MKFPLLVSAVISANIFGAAAIPLMIMESGNLPFSTEATMKALRDMKSFTTKSERSLSSKSEGSLEVVNNDITF